MLRILVAGRDAACRGFIRRIVAHQDPQTELLEYECGWQVMGALEAQDCSLALVEQDLPHLCGTEILRRAQLLCSTTPIVLVAGRASRELAQQALRLGAYDLLETPVLAPRVMATLRRVGEARTHISSR